MIATKHYSDVIKATLLGIKVNALISQVNGSLFPNFIFLALADLMAFPANRKASHSSSFLS